MATMTFLIVAAALMTVSVSTTSADEQANQQIHGWPWYPYRSAAEAELESTLNQRGQAQANDEKAVDGQANQQMHGWPWYPYRSAAERTGRHEAELESWLSQRGQAQANDARAVDNELPQGIVLFGSDNQKNETLIPEASNYDRVAQPHCGCCLCICCRRRKRSILRDPGNPRLKLSEIVIFGSATELKLYSEPVDRIRLYQSPVARAELYSRPLDPATPVQVSDALGGLQHAVVATLTDGRRFLVVKGNQKGEGTQTVIVLADHMTDDWTKVTTKDVSQSTLGDFANAGGDNFDPLNDNGTQAARRMMALP